MFFSSLDVPGCHLTKNVSCFDDQLADDSGMSCFHFRFNNSSR